MNIQSTWVKKRRVTVQRMVGMLKCRVLHMHMINVLRQIEMIPKVPRCFGSGTHKDVGLLGVVALAAGLSINVVDQEKQQIQ